MDLSFLQEEYKEKKIIIALMTCKTSKRYMMFEEFVRNVWGKDIIEGKYPNIKLIFYDFHDTDSLTNEMVNDTTLLVSNFNGNTFVKDNFYSTSVKTINAFKYIFQNFDFDFLYKGNTSTFLNIGYLNSMCGYLNPENDFIYTGKIYYSQTFTGITSRRTSFFHPCGNSVIYNRKIVEEIVYPDLKLLSNNVFYSNIDNFNIGKIASNNCVVDIFNSTDILNHHMTDDMYISSKLHCNHIARQLKNISMLDKIKQYAMYRNYAQEHNLLCFHNDDYSDCLAMQYMANNYVSNELDNDDLESIQGLMHFAYNNFANNKKEKYSFEEIKQLFLNEKRNRIDTVDLQNCIDGGAIEEAKKIEGFLKYKEENPCFHDEVCILKYCIKPVKELRNVELAGCIIPNMKNPEYIIKYIEKILFKYSEYNNIVFFINTNLKDSLLNCKYSTFYRYMFLFNNAKIIYTNYNKEKNQEIAEKEFKIKKFVEL